MVYDNTCKYLAENYPEAFVNWLLNLDTQDIEVLKTELGLEPIRADSLSFIKVANKILHLEFQTLPASDPPLPFRMLDYYVRLKRKYNCDIEQVVIFLRESSNYIVFTQEYRDQKTTHQYRVVRLWEQEPATFLNNPSLLPFASLTRTNNPQNLLEQIAREVYRMEEPSQQQNILTCVAVLAGLRFNPNLVQQVLRRDIMRESAFYQEILREGREEGQQQGEATLIIRLLKRKFDPIAPELQTQIQSLSIPELEKLAEDLLDFKNISELNTWLEQNRNEN